MKFEQLFFMSKIKSKSRIFTLGEIFWFSFSFENPTKIGLRIRIYLLIYWICNLCTEVISNSSWGFFRYEFRPFFPRREHFFNVSISIVLGDDLLVSTIMFERGTFENDGRWSKRKRTHSLDQGRLIPYVIVMKFKSH